MPPIHHVVTGIGRPPIVFVHGFACAHTDWNAQVAHLSPRHQTVAVDLRGHGESAGTPSECSIEQYGADVAEVVQALGLPPAVLVGHSMGFRVVIEAALLAPANTDRRDPHRCQPVRPCHGSRAQGSLRRAGRLFGPDEHLVQRHVHREERRGNGRLRHRPRRALAAIHRGKADERLADLRYRPPHRLHTALRVHAIAIQTTYSNEKRERRSMSKDQTTPYLDMLRTSIPSVRIEIIVDTGHFPQIDESARTNALLDSFIATLPTPT
jgi:pimeloyl-ACP methyl ester carboxylesterase